MKKAEIIKNGNVNLKPIKTGIDWEKIRYDFFYSKVYDSCIDGFATPKEITQWFKKRIEKELNQ